MNQPDVLFSGGDLADTLNHQLTKIPDAVAAWNEDRPLPAPWLPGTEVLTTEPSPTA
ncbi:hypothetical protein ABZ070_16780 [Streptomyces sp. NPDC006283]|uniref:hypothetical protein n=1 Tax=Streptomyces sp. NPDC006283 TaxID=3156741 RepID=UPI0033ABF658